MNKKNDLVLFTSIYPLPWLPNKATFNFQQYSRLAEKNDVEFVVPVPWLDFFKNIKQLVGSHNYKHVCYFPFFYIPGFFRGINSFLLVLSIFITIVPLIKLIKAKTVLASWAFPDAIACALLKPLCRYRFFIQCLGSDVNVHCENNFRRKLLKMSFEKADGVITVSKALQKKVLEVAPKANAKTIYNGVNFEKFYPSFDKFDETSIIFIGNLIKTKGVHELIAAIKILQSPEHNYHFHILGNGPEKSELEKTTQQEGIQDTITFHGVVDHAKVVDFLKKSHLLVLPSYQEGVPNVIMEAFACGVPVVATQVGGIPEVLNEQNGVLINTYAEQNIVAGIQECLSRSWDSQAIRQSIKSYTWDENINQLSAFLFPNS